MIKKLILLFCLASAASVFESALADIRTTPHSLVRSTGKKSDASEICVFCHTPNVAGTPPSHAPLWQRSIGTDLVFTIYDDIGRLGLGKASIGSQSIACLSCHDANQARTASKTSVDHPFGVPYRGASGPPPAMAAVRKTAGDESGNPSMRSRHAISYEDFRNVSQGVVENRTVWWVSRSGSGARRTRNDLPLYERHDDESGRNVPFIECSSCHDPHSSNSKFLRLSNDSSQLCLTCHIK